MFMNKLNAKWRKKNVHTKRERKIIKNTLYNICRKKKTIEPMNIALIVHLNPKTLREARGGGGEGAPRGF